MTAQHDIKAYLEREPRARERANKDRAIINVLMREYPALETIPKPILIEFVQQYATYDRAWRQTLEKNPHLRGTDYQDKAQLETEKQRELGYPV